MSHGFVPRGDLGDAATRAEVARAIEPLGVPRPAAGVFGDFSICLCLNAAFFLLIKLKPESLKPKIQFTEIPSANGVILMTLLADII